MQTSETMLTKLKVPIILIVALSMIMEGLDSTVLNTSLPQIAKSLHTNPIDLKVVITSYLLAVGVFIPMSSWVADRIGERRTLLLAIVIFLLGSIGCAFSLSVSMLVGFRLLQGVGGAFLAPAARLVLVRMHSKQIIVRAMAFVSTILSLSMVLGPLVGGAITTFISWRWIFFLNVPLRLIGSILVYLYLKNTPQTVRRSFDFLGFVLMGAALGALLFMVDILVHPDFSLLDKLSILCFVFLVGFFYMLHEKRAKFPIVDLSLFKARNYCLAALGSLLYRFSMSTVPFLVPLMLQATYGYTALQAGLFAVPAMLGMLVSRVLIQMLIRRLGYRRLLLINTGVSFFCFTSYVVNGFVLLPTLLLVQQLAVGFTMSLQYTAMNSLAYLHLKPERQSQGVSVYSAVIQLSGSFGVAIAALIMILTIGHQDLTHFVPQLAFRVVFLIQAVFVVLSWFVFYFLDKGSAF